MTCVLSSPWHPFSTSYGWSPMNSESSMPTSAGSDKPHHGYASSESESRQASSSSGKKRASRAGTRSVTTLSAAQLERKRANDREAQRAIRQRTKDHIDGLERSANELRAAHDASEKMLAATQQRNRELEDENAYLRAKLGENGYPVSIPPTDNQRPSDPNLFAAHSMSPAAQVGSIVPRPESTPTPRSSLSLNTSQASTSRQASWQQTPSTMSSSTAGTTPTLSAPGTMQTGSTLTTWRSHDSKPSVHPNSGQMHDHSHTQPPHYATSHPHDRSQWSGGAHAYQYQEQQRNQHFGSPTQTQPQYVQSSVPTYASAATPQQPSYAAPPQPPQPPQAEFQGMAVSSPAPYQHSFPPSAQYPMTTMQVPPSSNPDYAPPQNHMQTPPIPATQYHQIPNDQQYGQQQMQANMQFREDPSNRGYSLTHYPSG